jgi:hypothetical protein
MCSANLPINGVLLKEKAIRVATRLRIENFKGSNGWLGRFKKCHGLEYKSVSGESASVDEGTADYWKSVTLVRYLQGYKPNDIFNADATGIFFNLLPSKTLASRGDRCQGGKKSKDRITALLCGNSDGSEKLTPLIIGKFAKPRLF